MTIFIRNLIVLMVLSIFSSAHAQSTQKFTLKFENTTANKILTEGWFQWGNYELSVDSVIQYTGDNSGKIDSGNNSGSFGSIAYRIPANYEGDSIKLSGFMKTQEVADEFAGLLLRVDGNSGSLVFSNMQDQNITSTNEWKKYEITLPFPKGANEIYVAGILVGKGAAWIDDFVVQIDDENLQSKKEVEKPILPAALDKEFDSGTKISFTVLSDQKIEQLAILGKIWRFLNYYHPKIGKGDIHWDYELFRILPKVHSNSSMESFQGELFSWIKAIGDIQACNTCRVTSQEAFLKPDLTWIHKSLLGDDLSSLLMEIYENRHQGEHFYFCIGKAGNVDLANETVYGSMTYPDEGFRLLSLFRYCNVMHYFFPYKHLIGRGWAEVLEEYVPKFIKASSELEYELATAALLVEINDTHGQLGSGVDKLNDLKGKYDSNLRLNVVQNKIVVIDYYNSELIDNGGPKLGDIITHVNDIPVDQIVDNVITYYSG